MTRKSRFFSISNGQIEEIRKVFDGYSAGFFNNDVLHNKHIEIKRIHTRRVCQNIIEIAQSLEMNEGQQNYVELLALMHDIGRFEQYRKYQTFSDSDSENHSLIAVRVINKENILNFLSKEQKYVIFRAILNHNIRLVPYNEDPVIDFYSRILRDSDKLDIWRITSEMNIMFKLEETDMPDSYIVPPNYIKEFSNQRPIRIEQAANIYDTILLRLSWIYDLNFTRSFELMKEREIMDKLTKKIPESFELLQIKALVIQYLKEKCAIYSIR